MSKDDEQELVQQAQHDSQAFAALYERYVDRIYAFIFRQTQDTVLTADVTAATFEQALRHLRTYRWQGQSFGAWLYRIARNELLQHYRRERFLLPLRWFRIRDTKTEHVMEFVEQHDEIRSALARLSKADQEVLRLRFFEDLSSAEVATVLQCSTTTVYLRVHRALRRLRTEIDAMGMQGVINVTE